MDPTRVGKEMIQNKGSYKNFTIHYEGFVERLQTKVRKEGKPNGLRNQSNG
jgi:hypothetical protein